MAGGCITPPPFTTTTLLPRKSLLLACALTTPRPRKLSNRKNYLRPKILKTTTKPPKSEHLETPIQHTHIVNDTETTFYETPLQQTHIFSSDITAGDQLKTSENQQLRLSEVSDPSGAVNATADISVDRNSGSSLFEAVDSKESRIQETATISNTGNILVEAMDSGESHRMKSTTTMNRRKKSNRNGTSNMKEVEDQKVLNPKEGTKSGNDTDFWWFSLPYVLAIRMRRGHDEEGPEGLFALKSSFQVNGSLSHTVTFEDPGDATNFCSLLQSFFEDLGDFSAEIVPLPVQELREAIKSHTMKVIVVKKGKLKLYAGQPLADAEIALRSLIEQE